jgi:hypothetical protein
MITRAKHKQGEGILKAFNLEVGRASQRKKMAEEDKRDEQEKNFHMVFYRMFHKAYFKKPLLKLDVNFDLPMFNGDVNPEKLDNWI